MRVATGRSEPVHLAAWGPNKKRGAGCPQITQRNADLARGRFAGVRLGVLKILRPVGGVFRGAFGIADHQQVLGVALIGGFGEIERAGERGLAVDDHDFVVSDGVLGVDEKVAMPELWRKSAEE